MRVVHRLVTLAAGVVAVVGLVAVDAQRPAPVQPPAPALPMPAILKAYPPVTPARLRAPADGDWLMIRRTYDGWGYSPLDQITTANVAQLRPVWIFATGATNGHEAPPIVNGGVMFVSTPGNQVIAVEAKTGTLLWRYRRPLPEDAVVMHPTSRGIALYGDKVYLAANEGVLVALDARTGKEVWTADVGENQRGYYMTLAPLAADGLVMIGASGGEFGIRGFVAAYDAETGKPAWKTYTVPAPGEPGSETWPKGDQWKTGGAPVWVTGNYDPEAGLAYWGTGNGGPWMGDQRPGRQPLHRIDGGRRREDRQDPRPLPVPPERLVGLGRGVAADPRRLPARRPHREGAGERRPQRLLVVPRARRRSDRLRAGDAVRAPDGVPQPRSQDRPPGHRPGPQAGHRQEGGGHLSRRTGAARTGRRSPSARRRG